MSSQFHNRLVGTVVLVALGVIFLPDILDGKKDHQEEQFAEIPLRPNLIEQQKNADDMFEVLSAQDVGELAGAQVELAESQPNDEAALAQAVKSTPPKAESVKSEPVKETSKPQTAKVESKSEPKKEPAKSTATKTEPVKKPEAKPTTVAKTEKPKTDIAKPSKDEVKVVSRESLKPGLTLQLGAFSNAANVKALVAQLRKNGFKAYTIPDNPKDGVLTKVFVGPDISEAKLKKMQEDIERLTHLKGRIVPFNPLES
ncbi:cell division protein DedD [Shewanella sp. CG12_big_fil_rev_8_21_14_0_65_47_15]|uniref:cell division protein DedD n=1 Tax=Shewanella sp. CG12_big_fil_rev_8_21_14_0_65_47_15 TaxID=1975537 RepID=UPI000CC1A4E2|nr:cell division protein DedD [Shewanella sp. CG12_big_fil_rev_8_21_14_0_65_47_15]PIW61266.1 MAG: sporulation protein [Shewanella sp. CG12_big_fil_rev_8_21_14_0_65_47_15]